MINYRNIDNNAAISQLVQIGTASGYLQGIGYQVPFEQHDQNLKENVYALLKFSGMEIDFETASRIVSGDEIHCAHKKLQGVLATLAGYRQFIKFMGNLDVNTTPDAIVDFFITLNHTLQTAEGLYDTAYNPGVRENTQKLLGEILSPYFQRRVTTSYVEIPLFFNRIFNEYSNPGYEGRKVSKELVLFMTLFLLYREEPHMLHASIAKLVETVKINLSTPGDVFVSSFLTALHGMFYPLACSLYSQRKAREAALESQPRKLRKLLSVMPERISVSASDIMKKLGFQDGRSFRRNYLHPALEQGFIEKALLDKNTSPYQAYQITEKGLNYMAEMKAPDLRITT